MTWIKDKDVTVKGKRPLMRMYLVRLKQKAGISSYDLAQKLFLDKSSYYRIETGEKGHRMGAPFYHRLAKELNIPVEIIINEEVAYQKERVKAGLIMESWYLIDWDEQP